MSETTTRVSDALSPAPADPRFPVGRFELPAGLSPEGRAAAIEILVGLPAAMRTAVAGLPDSHLDTRYREGGWTVRQVVHHVPDSHFNAYVRMKLAVTEDVPTVKPYDEKAWSELFDARTMPVEVSLVMLDALHTRWVYLLRSFQPADFSRTVTHPEWDRPMSVDMLLALYSWHSRHHLAHITSLRDREGW